MKVSRLLFLFVLFFFFSQHRGYLVNIFINEFMANPSDGIEWVEFYHPIETTLTGYYLDDDPNGGSSRIQLTDTNVITSGNYSYVEISKSFLNNSGDFVTLLNSTGNVIDQYQYKTSEKGVSIGRSPDGTGSFSSLAGVIKGSANSPVKPTATLTSTKTPNPMLSS